jgi:hypothetical protein
MNENEKNAQRRARQIEQELRFATDLTDEDVIQWERAWTEVRGVYRDLDEWEAIFGRPEQGWYPVSGLADEPRLAAEALDWSSPMYVVLELLDRGKSNPGEIATRFVQVYMHEPVTVLSRPAWEPSPAEQAPLTANTGLPSLAELADDLEQIQADILAAREAHDPIGSLSTVTRVLRLRARLAPPVRADQMTTESVAAYAFTEGLLAAHPMPTRLAMIAGAISAWTGTDDDTASWLAARVFTMLEAMRVESGAYPKTGDPRPWDVAAWLADLGRGADVPPEAAFRAARRLSETDPGA